MHILYHPNPSPSPPPPNQPNSELDISVSYAEVFTAVVVVCASTIVSNKLIWCTDDAEIEFGVMVD